MTNTIKVKGIHDRLTAEAIYHYEQFEVKRSKTYKAGFDNGYGMGYYHGLKRAAELCMDPVKTSLGPPCLKAKSCCKKNKP